jgi:hypothetical protein
MAETDGMPRRGGDDEPHDPHASQPFWRRYLRLWGADARADVDDELAFAP